eukprot:TRINITY_DN2576_c3_g1_i2.p1 TRINITY_DN2576_c3_g1~~TRINITY_DN2576_c3_g1_i2.p1  ORF type:complete len:357 (+),score=86.47 TRINITY_DN2576_c3_g1_i2:29-1072(+)
MPDQWGISVSGRLKKSADERNKMKRSTPVGKGGRSMRHLSSNPRSGRGSPTLSYQSGISGVSGTGGVVNAYLFGDELDLKTGKKQTNNNVKKAKPAAKPRPSPTSDMPLSQTVQKIQKEKASRKPAQEKAPVKKQQQQQQQRNFDKTLQETMREIKKNTPVKAEPLSKTLGEAIREIKKNTPVKAKKVTKEAKDKTLQEAVREIKKRAPEPKDKTLQETVQEIKKNTPVKEPKKRQAGKRKQPVEHEEASQAPKRQRIVQNTEDIKVRQEVGRIVDTVAEEHLRSVTRLHSSNLSSFLNKGIQELLKVSPPPASPALWLGRWLTSNHKTEPESPKLMDVLVSMSQGQ